MKKLNLLLLIIFVLLSSTQSLMFLGQDASSQASAHHTSQTPSNLANPQASSSSGVLTWTNISANVGPRPFRGNTQMVYDAADGYSILLDEIGTTWKFSAGSWVQISPSSTHPAYRTYARMVYDAADGYVVYFGGLYLGWMNDTWKFQAGTWTNITSTAGLAPSGRNQYALGYDDADHYALLFGGGCSSAFKGCLLSGGSFREFSDTWKFQGGSWTNITSTVGTTPSPDNLGASIVYDPSDGYTILVGQGGTWKFSGGTWSKLVISGPIIGSDAGLVYDNQQGYVVVFGGCCSFSQTWKFYSGAWANITSIVGTPPSPRLEFGMTYDGASRSTILFGGQFYDATHLGPAFFSDTWKLAIAQPPAIPVTNCQALTSAGSTYTLTNSIAQASSVNGGFGNEYTCILMAAPNISFNLNGFNITDTRQSGDDCCPIQINSVNDTVTGPGTLRGIYGLISIAPLAGAEVPSSDCHNAGGPIVCNQNATIRSVTLLGNSDTGIYFSDSICGSLSCQPFISTGDFILNNTIAFISGIGIDLYGGGSAITIANNIITHNGIGVRVPSSGNLIYNNFFDNTINAQSSNPAANSWNTTKTPGRNIVGGPFIGGNFWSDYNGTDPDGDGFGDTFLPFNSTGGIAAGGDYLPLFSQGFGLSVNPISVGPIQAGSSGVSLITIAGNKTFSAYVSLTAQPSSTALVASLGAASLKLTPQGSNETRLTLSGSTPGSYSVTVTATAGSITHSVTVAVTVVAALHPTAVSISCAPNPIPTGAPTTCTATVNDPTTSPATATGFVVFTLVSGSGVFDSDLCKLSGQGASASCQVTYTYQQGSVPVSGVINTIGAAYGGDSLHSTSVSSAYSVTVIERNTVSSLSCLPSSVKVNESTVCSVTVTDVSPGISPDPLVGQVVTFYTNSVGTFSSTYSVQNQCVLAGTFPVAGCSLNYNATQVGSGTHKISITYSFYTNASFSNFNLTVTATALHATTTTVSCTPKSVPVHFASYCTATVNDTSASGATVPAGTVDFAEVGIATGTFFSGSPCTLSGLTGVSASCQVIFVSANPGVASITASYTQSASDTTHAGSSSTTPATVTVTLTFLQSLCYPNIIAVGQSQTCVIAVSDVTGASPPTGTVTFTVAGVTGSFTPSACTLVQFTIAGSLCTVTFSASKEGTANVTAQYNGDATHPPNSISLQITVANLHPTTILLVCNPTTATSHQLVTCTATVTDTSTSAPSTPTGTINLEFLYNPMGGSIVSCTLAGTGATATCSGTGNLTRAFGPQPPASIKGDTWYDGDTAHDGSVTTFSLNLVRTTATTISCPANGTVGTAFTCTVIVTDDDTGTTITPTGTVSFTISSTGAFNGPPCTLAGTGASATCTGSVSPTAPGPLQVTANYPSDSIHYTSTSATVTVTITPTSKATPTITSLVSPTSVRVGGSASDLATISGGSSPTGNVAYKAYSDSACTTLVFTSSGIALGSPSAAFTPTAPGTYYFVASYSGDGNNNPVSTACGAPGETLTVVSPPVPTLTTVIKDANGKPVTSIVAGALAHDTATITPTSPSTVVTGTITYSSYSNGACTGQPFVTPDQVTITTAGTVPDSASGTAGTGTYSVQATYSGDANNSPVTSSCEVLTITKASPTLLTLLSSNSITIGNAVSDSATLTGGFQAGGTVTYSVFTNNICTAPGKIVSTVAVTAGVVPDSRQATFNSTGDFGFQASYSGDANNNPVTSSCEPLTVSTNVSIRTSLSATTNIVGGSLMDSATLVGQSVTASGTVTYSDFADGVCAGPITTVSVVNVANGIIPDSRAVIFNSTGSFSFEAVYSGDANDNSAISSCESLTIQKSTPHITSTVTPSAITVGSSATDLASVSGFIPTGTITYTVYSDSSCTTSGFISASVPLGTSSAAFTPIAAGIYYWIASYSGDSNNNAVATTCGSVGETLTVNGLPFDYSLSVSPTSASIIAGSSISATVTATLLSGTAQPVTLLLSISPNPTVCQVTSNPCGAVSLSPTSITPSSNGATSTLTGTTTRIAPPGTYILTITGSPAGSSHSSATFTLTISAPSVSTVGCGHDLSCSVISNATLTRVKFAGITIHAEADGTKGTHGYANITVPKSAIPNIDNLHVFVDNSKLSNSDVTVTSNSTDYFIYFTFTFHSPVQIDIQLTAPDPTPNAPTILGLSPTLFYVILGFVIVVIVIASASPAIRGRGKTGVISSLKHH